MTEKEAKKLIENVKIEHNHEMLVLLEEEQSCDGERDEQLKLVFDDRERKRLDKIFGMERAKAHARIQTLSE